MQPFFSSTRASMISWPTTKCRCSRGLRSSTGTELQGMYCMAAGADLLLFPARSPARLATVPERADLARAAGLRELLPERAAAFVFDLFVFDLLFAMSAISRGSFTILYTCRHPPTASGR